MPKKQKEIDRPLGEKILPIFQGTLITCIIAVLFLVIAAIFIGSGMLSEKRMGSIILLICSLSAFLTGVIQKGRMGQWTALNGIVSAALACLVFAGVGLLIWKKISLEEGRNIVISCVCGGGLAGVLFGKRRKQRRG